MPLREYNDYTRMTRAQLADRIRQMEATAARNSQLGAPNDRHRPMEDRRRREKIALYRAELDRRTLADAAQDARDRAEHAELTARAQAAVDARAAEIEQHHGKAAAAGYRAVAEHSIAIAAQADARENPPCDCHFAGDAADASECEAHGPTAIQNTATPDTRAATAEEPDMRNPFDDYATAPPSCQEWQERQEASDRYNRERADRLMRADEFDAGPSNAALERATPADYQQLPPIASSTAQPAPGRRPGHSRKRYHTDPDEQQQPAPAPAPHAELDTAVEDLVRRYTCGSVIDAAWAAAHRIFHPQKAS